MRSPGLISARTRVTQGSSCVSSHSSKPVYKLRHNSLLPHLQKISILTHFNSFEPNSLSSRHAAVKYSEYDTLCALARPRCKPLRRMQAKVTYEQDPFGLTSCIGQAKPDGITSVEWLTVVTKAKDGLKGINFSTLTNVSQQIKLTRQQGLPTICWWETPS